MQIFINNDSKFANSVNENDEECFDHAMKLINISGSDKNDDKSRKDNYYGHY